MAAEIRRQVVEVRDEKGDKLLTLSCGHVIREHYLADGVGSFHRCPACEAKDGR